MEDRYKSLFRSNAIQMQEGVPILLAASALYGDTFAGKVVAQLKFQNISSKAIKAVYISLTCYDVMKSVIGTQVEAKYLDLHVNSGDFFGDRIPVVMSDNSIRSFKVKITSVMYADDSLWCANEETFMENVKEPDNTLSFEQIGQLQIEAGARHYAISPAVMGDKIRCACSQWNDGNVEKCVRCHSDLKWLLENSDSNVLQTHLEKRLAEEAEIAERRRKEKARKEEAERIEREKRDKEEAERRAIEEAKRKKKNRAIGAVTSVAVVGACIFGFVVKPELERKNTYESAVIMLNNGEYAKASDAFTELGSYKDSAILLSRVKADELYALGNLSEAYEIYKGLDVEYQIHEDEYKTMYSDAEKALAEGDYASAVALFESIRGYADSAEQVDAVYYAEAGAAYADGDFEGAGEKFASLGEYSDSADRAKQSEADGLFESGDYIAAYEIYAGLGQDYQTHNDSYVEMYEAAKKLMEEEDYTGAAAAFAEIENYSDSKECISAAHYKAGEAALEAADVVIAKARFTSAGEYSDSAAKIQAITNYEQGITLQESGKYAEARTAYMNSGILDCEERIDACYAEDYSAAETLLNQGDVASAYAMFESISAYSDSAEKIQFIDDVYNQANEDAEAGDYDAAISGYVSLKNYSDCEDKVKSTTYAKAESQISEGYFDDAILTFESLGEYEDCADRIIQTHYEKAQVLENNGEMIDAAEEYAVCGEYKDSAEKLISLSIAIADEAFANKDYGTALEYYTNLEQTEELKMREYELAQTCFDEGIYEQAVKAYEVLGQYELSLSRLPVARYAWAEQLQENEQYQKAAEQFAILGDVSDSVSRTRECTYLYGKQLLNTEEYDEAKAVFETILYYSDAIDMAKECDYQKASSLMKKREYAVAGEIFKSLESYQDSVAQSTECAYQIAIAALEAKDYETAQSGFEALGEYSDSVEKVKFCIYERANILMHAFNYADAQVLYESISGYKDADALVLACRYQQALISFDAGEYDAAIAILEGMEEYEDSADIIINSHYANGLNYVQNGKTAEAVNTLVKASILPEAQELLYRLGKDYASMNQNLQAVETLWACGAYEPAGELLKEIGDLLLLSDSIEDGVIAYLASGDRESAEQKLGDLTKYDLVSKLNDYVLLESDVFRDAVLYEFANVNITVNPQKAFETFMLITEYKDVPEILAASEAMQIVSGEFLEKANELFAKEEYEKAADIYETLLLTGHDDKEKRLISSFLAFVSNDVKKISFGEYPKGSSVIWRIAKVSDASIIYVSDNALDYGTYEYNSYIGIPEVSTIIDKMQQNMFSSGEAKLVSKLGIPSSKEMEAWYPEKALRIFSPTSYAADRYEYFNNEEYSEDDVWLSDTGHDSDLHKISNPETGEIDTWGKLDFYSEYICPYMELSLSKELYLLMANPNNGYQFYDENGQEIYWDGEFSGDDDSSNDEETNSAFITFADYVKSNGEYWDNEHFKGYVIKTEFSDNDQFVYYWGYSDEKPTVPVFGFYTIDEALLEVYEYCLKGKIELSNFEAHYDFLVEGKVDEPERKRVDIEVTGDFNYQNYTYRESIIQENIRAVTEDGNELTDIEIGSDFVMEFMNAGLIALASELQKSDTGLTLADFGIIDYEASIPFP